MAKHFFLMFILLQILSAVFSGDNVREEAANPVDFKVPMVKYLSVGAAPIARKMLKNKDPKPEQKKKVCDDHDVDCKNDRCYHVKTSTGDDCACESELDYGDTLTAVFCVPRELEDSSSDDDGSSDDSSDYSVSTDEE